MQNESLCSHEPKLSRESSTLGLSANTPARGDTLYHDIWCCCCCWDRIQPAGPVPPNVSSGASLPDCPRWTEPSVAPGASFSASVPAVLSGENTEKSICYWPPNSSNPRWKTRASFTPSPAAGKLDIGMSGYTKSSQKTTTNSLLKHLLLKTANN